MRETVVALNIAVMQTGAKVPGRTPEKDIIVSESSSSPQREIIVAFGAKGGATGCQRIKRVVLIMVSAVNVVDPMFLLRLESQLELGSRCLSSIFVPPMLKRLTNCFLGC